MPSLEELPIVAQNEIKAQAGQVPSVGLAAHKKKVGFLERLANVGRSLKEPEAKMEAKREPEFGQNRVARPPEPSKPQVSRPQPQGQSAAPKSLRIERPRGELAPPALPKQVEVQPRALAAEMADRAPESHIEDDLEIPAFLRRRAN
jgi:cell division protein FtsZ